MKAGISVLGALWLFLTYAAAPVRAGEAFQITYQQEQAGEAAVLVVTVYNTSGQDVRDLVASVQGLAGRVHIAELADGRLAEVRGDFPATGSLGDTALCMVEFTNAQGDRETASVLGYDKKMAAPEKGAVK